jgi:hypothetical protein
MVNCIALEGKPSWSNRGTTSGFPPERLNEIKENFRIATAPAQTRTEYLTNKIIKYLNNVILNEQNIKT